MASFRWACRFVAQDAATIEAEDLAELIRYGTDGLKTISPETVNLLPMFSAALLNIFALEDNEKGKETIKHCFVEQKDVDGICYRDLLMQLVEGEWLQKAADVSSTEGEELLNDLKTSLLKIK